MKVILFLLFAAILAGCSGKDFEGSSKFEAALNMKLKEMIRNDNTSEIGIILKVNDDFSESNKKQLSDAGISIGSNNGGILTATGAPENIIKLDSFDFVRQVQLAKQNYMK